jgi:3-methyl-2-oxobutanoate hydroxymethyltransferase
MNILDFKNKKLAKEKITMVTCYDYTSARMLSQTSIDCLLVGDSVAMTMHGYKDTTAATIEMMCFHTSAVSRGAGDKLIVSDLPFLSYRKSLSKSVTAIHALMQAGAHAIKLEGTAGNIKLIRHLTESGIPVVGHIGLTPQHINILGGYKIQGRTDAGASQLKQDALALQEAGCIALVLECVPKLLAKEITQLLFIPTIGVGAGGYTDGQVLVFQDLLGLNIDLAPKFVKNFVNGFDYFKNGIETYVKAVKLSEYPQDEHSYEYS